MAKEVEKILRDGTEEAKKIAKEELKEIKKSMKWQSVPIPECCL